MHKILTSAAFALAAVATLSLASCGGDAAKTTETTSTETTTEATATEGAMMTDTTKMEGGAMMADTTKMESSSTTTHTETEKK